MQDNIIDNDLDDGLLLSVEGQKHLRIAGKWAYFIGIAGAIVCILFGGGSFVGLLGAGMMSAMDSSPIDMGAFTALMIFVILVVFSYIIPCVYMVRFAIQASKGLHVSSGNTISKAMKELKIAFVSFSIITILFFGVYIISIMVSMAALGSF